MNKQIFKATLTDGKIKLDVDTGSMVTLVMALKLLELQVENMIIGGQQPKASPILPIISPDVLKRMRS